MYNERTCNNDHDARTGQIGLDRNQQPRNGQLCAATNSRPTRTTINGIWDAKTIWQMRDELNQEAMQAIRYFWGAGMLDNCHGDQRHYLETLVYFAAEKLHVELA